MIDEPLISVELIEAQQKKHEKSGLEEPLEYGCVIYTDGGSKHNAAGYGIHGFVYANTPTKVGCGISGYTVTDYGYLLNGGHPTVKLNDIYKVNESEIETTVHPAQPVVYFDASGSILQGTNNVAEAIAFLKSLDIVEQLYKELKITKVHYRVDSKYIINGLLRRYDYISNGWHNSTGVVANKEIWVEIAAKLELLSTLPLKWTIEWTQGHSDYFGNIQADKLATMARTAASNQYEYDKLTVYPAQGHWSADATDVKSNPSLYFMVDSKWYYDSAMEMETRIDGLTPLFIGNHDTIGQPDGDSTMAIVLLKNPPRHLINLVKIAKTLDHIENGYENHGAFYANTNTILRSDFEQQIIQHDSHFLLTKQENKQILTFEDKEVLRRLDPPFLANDQMRKFSELHDILDRVVDGTLLKHELLNDVTDIFYSVTENTKGKVSVKLKVPTEAAIKVPVKVNRYDANYVYDVCDSEATLTYGIIAPRYRVFSGIKDYNPQVFVLTSYVAFYGFRYYTVIKLSTGEWGIWTNAEANLRKL